MSHSPAAVDAEGRGSMASSRRLVAILSVSATALWSLSLLLAVSLKIEGPPRTIALIVHLLALVLSFGAIMLVDWHGFLWLLGRRELSGWMAPPPR